MSGDGTETLRQLPDDLRERAIAVAGGHVTPVPARDAATVVLLRDAADHGVEAFLLRRVASMAFAAGMWVFPGGSVDRRDADVGATWIGQPPEHWSAVLGADASLAGALVAAAVRETFEECGVLLAGTDETAVAAVAADPDHWERERAALLDRSASVSDVLARNGLRLRADLLRPWAHWVTPEIEPKRFDTRFFVAALPEGQAAAQLTTESDRGGWWRPAAALGQHAAGQFAMLPPTAFTLAELAEFGSVADVLAAADRREIRRVLPRVVVDGEDVRLLVPGDEGYPDG